MEGQTCTAASRLPPTGRKTKSKAPLPPSDTRITDCAFDESELNNFAMEQKENIIDRDIELSVVLPGDVVKSTTVNGSKPMMDLLVYLCAQYRLNPASHTIDLMSAERKQIKFKPNTPIGMLEVDKVILKPKQMDKKKTTTPVIPEQTIRVVVNYKKTQKTIVRVSPHAPLQDIMQIICSKCDFDPLHTLLLKTYQSQETLDMTKSLNELGLRELYAMDVSRVTPTAEFGMSSFQDSCQNSQNLDILKEKENKGFFSFFQRSKKKREQTASAPATPLMSKPRPVFPTKPSTVSKQYDSSTLPSDMPKKRRAPLPPMAASQSMPQDLAETQSRPAAGVVKSSSVDETNKGLSGIGIVRSGSFQLSGTSSVNSSLRRAKRKAPSPPPRKLQGQSDNSIETGSESTESVHTEGSSKGRLAEVPSPTGHVIDLPGSPEPSGVSCYYEPTSHDQNNVLQVSDETNLVHADTPDESEVSLKSDIGSEYSLEEIDEKEEMHGENTDTSPTTLEVPTSFSTSEMVLNVTKNESVSLASDPSIGTGEPLESSNEKTENLNADSKTNEKITFDNGKPLGEMNVNIKNGHCDSKFLSVTEENKNNGAEMKRSNQADALICPTYESDLSLNQEGAYLAVPGLHDKNGEEPNVGSIKTQDVAIQTNPSNNYLDQMAPQGCKSVVPRDSPHTDRSTQENQPSVFLNREVITLKELNQQIAFDKENLNGNKNNTLTNDNDTLPKKAVTSPGSPTKGYPLYRQDSKPKPKPSNEITREYIPKVGMTTYKIVPPRSLELVKNWESESVENREAASLLRAPEGEDFQDFGTQTEIMHVSKSQNQTGWNLKHEATLSGNYQLPGGPDTVSFSNAKGKEMETSKPVSYSRITPLVLSADNKASSPPVTQEKTNILSPTPKPSNFYLQMQRRVSGHYVTSAVARSGSLSSPTQSEAKSIDTEKKLSLPDQTAFPFPKGGSFQSVEEKAENGHSEEKTEAAVSPKPLNSPASAAPPLNLKTLRTFVLPQPYSSSRPSPFALAVSSAVRRSQSFSKTCASATRPLEEQPSLDLPSSKFNREIKNHSSLESPPGPSQESMANKQNNCASSDPKRQVPSPFSGPPKTAVCEPGKAAVTLQRPDPAEIHQSLLDAIRSGEAAAKLRRVAPPSNTVSFNRQSSLSASVAVEARYSNH